MVETIPGFSKAEAQARLNKCSDDEPVFLLRGQDLSFPLVIRFWVNTVGELGLTEATRELVQHRSLMLQTAITGWRQRNKDRIKLPD